jgi:hypothetical protein
MRTKRFKNRDEMRDAITREIQDLNLEIERIRLLASSGQTPDAQPTTPQPVHQSPKASTPQLALN